MKVNLISFQDKAVKELRVDIADALDTYRRRQKTQVVSLQAPTGAGKTIIAAALIESIYYGMTLPDGNTFDEQPEAIFVWLSDSLSYRKEAVRRLADSYYASVFQGKMGSDEYSELFRTWLNEMTAYFLKEQLQSAGLDHGTLFALASTIYLKTQWVTAFNEKMTKNAVFSGARGEETVPFMNQQAAARGCFIGENYRMARLETKQGLIWFFLPDEDSTVAAMMEAASFRNWLAHTDLSLVPGIETRQGSVNISVPKLDIDASQDLIDGLAALGIRRCFETDQADLSPFLDFPGVCVGSAKQCSRLLLDEKGVIAASAVVMTGAAWAPPDRTIDFVVDRPFFLLITGPEAVPLFAAVINTIQP